MHVDRELAVKLSAIIATLLLLPAAYIFYGLDCWTGGSRNIYFEIGFLVWGAVMGAVAFCKRQDRRWLVPALLYGLFIGIMPFLELSPVKPAVIAVEEIKPGMSEAQVHAILDYHFPANGRFKRPDMTRRDDYIAFALDPNDGRYNAAILSVRFVGDKCLTASFSPD